MGTRAQRVSYIFGRFPTFMFAFRSIQLSKPIKFLVFSLCYSAAFFAYILRIFEYPMSIDNSTGFAYYPNSIWCTIVTMTSVGYGDMYPQTFLGRLVGVTLGLYGAVVNAVFVVSVTRILEYTRQEGKSYALLEKLDMKDELKEAAANVIYRIYRIKKAKTER